MNALKLGDQGLNTRNQQLQLSRDVRCYIYWYQHSSAHCRSQHGSDCSHAPLTMLAKSNGGSTQLDLSGTKASNMFTYGWEVLDSIGFPADFLLLLFLWPAFPFFGGAIQLSAYAQSVVLVLLLPLLLQCLLMCCCRFCCRCCCNESKCSIQALLLCPDQKSLDSNWCLQTVSNCIVSSQRSIVS